MDCDLICNNRKCRKPLDSGQAWTTSCSHIFCKEDGEKQLAVTKKCLACGVDLPGKLDIVRIELDPSEAYKSMVLSGQKPYVIFDICSRAMSYWAYQNQQESRFKAHRYEQLREKCEKMEKYCNKAVSNSKFETKSLMQELNNTKSQLETYKAKCEKLNTLLRDKSKYFNAQLRSATRQKLKGNLPITTSPSVNRAKFAEYTLQLGNCAQTSNSPPQRDFNVGDFCINASVRNSPTPSMHFNKHALTTDHAGSCDWTPDV